MDFYKVVDDVLALLRGRGRVTYRALKVQFQLDDEQVEALQEEVLYAKKLAVDEENRVLVWLGEQATVVPSTPEPISPPPTKHQSEPLSYTPKHLAEKILTSRSALEGERKQVTVLFCDLANSTAIAEKLGPEAMPTLLNRFFALALSEVHRYEGTINQFLGDGFMALIGAPISHEDHARRGVLSALSLQRTLKEAELGKPYGVECAFRQRLQDKRVTYLEGRCLSYSGSIPYHPFIDVLRNNCGIGETDSPGTIIDKVRLALQEVGMDAEESAPYLLQFLGVKEGTASITVLMPEAVRTRTFDTFRQMSLQGSQRRPLIFEIEDLHWCDHTSQDYLVSLVESLAGASIFLLTSYRPGYQPPWIGKSYTTQISLHSLTPHDGLSVVHSVLHGEKLPDQKEAQRTSSQKYIALGWALRGKIIAKLGDTEAAGAELQRAFTLADQLQSPSLIYPIAYDFGHWHESTGKEREAASLYGKAKATIEQMITAVEEETLRSTFRQSALVQEIDERAARLGG